MSRLKFKHPGNGHCPYIDVPEGRYIIQDKSLEGLEHVLEFHRAGGWLKDTGETELGKAKKAASQMITPGESIWWNWNGVGYTIKRGEWRYYLFRHGSEWPRHWFLRCCHDEEDVMAQGVESYLEFVRDCEEYVNERHGQISLF